MTANESDAAITSDTNIQPSSSLTDIESLKTKIAELNSLVSLQQYYIENWREKYNSSEKEVCLLKKEIKSIRIMEQENISLKNTINSKNEIIYNLLNPHKWQWCDFNGYFWKDFDKKLSNKIEKNYQNNKQIYRCPIITKNKTANSNSNSNSQSQMYEFKFNQNQQIFDNNKYKLIASNSNDIDIKNNDDDKESHMHRMTFYSSSFKYPLVYYIKRVSMDYKTNYYLNYNLFCGPARVTFGNKMLILYHVTDKSAANSIKKTKKMKCGTTGRFGGGIYFAENVSTAKRRAHSNGYVITAKVFVGKEYIVKENDYKQINTELNFDKLQKMNCDSVFAIKWTERVVYNTDQICIIDIKKVSLFSFFSK